MFKNIFFSSFLVYSVTGSLAHTMPKFDVKNLPFAPDYSKEMYWAALPFHEDMADEVPRNLVTVSDSTKQVDVFYIHPTTFEKGANTNADLSDKDLNDKTDFRPIKYQASAWNESCRVYAPRYRQANLAAFFDYNEDAKKALDVAYEDVKTAFIYYIEHYNQHRPFIIASHSQGTYHARKLIAELIDGKNLQQRMVCAYLVGYAVREADYKEIKACSSPHNTGCIVSWSTYKEGYEPPNADVFYKDAITVNPISWQTDTVKTDHKLHKGMMLLNFNKIIKGKIAAECHHNLLWVDVNYPIVKKENNLHVGDINLFWLDIRMDVKRRINYFWK